jgi:MipA family protein
MHQPHQILDLATPRALVTMLFLTCLPALAEEPTVSGELGTPAPQEAPAENTTQSHWRLGLGAGLIRSPYQGVDNKVSAMPFIGYENAWLRIMGPNIDGKLAHVGNFSFGLRSIWAFKEGHKSSDSDVFEGMDKRKGGLWIGPSMEWKTPVGMLAGDVLGDVSGHSQGKQARLSLGQKYHFDRIEVAPRVGLQWQDSKYVDYYYGVRDAEATAWRSEYRGRATLNLEATVLFNYSLTKQQALTSEIGLRHFGKGITDSPLVDKTVVPILRLGYTYSFQ